MTTKKLFCCVLLGAAAIGSGCRGPEPEPAPAALEPLDVTRWSDTSELFMEYPPLVAGQSAVFAVHLTWLRDFAPVTSGRASIEFTPEGGGPATVLTGNSPSRPGVFRVEGVPPPAGRYRWALRLDAPEANDRHDLDVTTIFADEETARVASTVPSADDPTAIAYLKEQQWTSDFATIVAQGADVRQSLRVPATVHPLPGGAAVVAAPAAGRLVSDRLPSIGDQVAAGEVLARLEPRLAAGGDRSTLAADVSEAQIALEGARAEQTRAERLLADRAVPARRVEDARRATAIAVTRLAAAEARLAQRDETLRSGGGVAAGNAYVLRSPIAGRVTDTSATLGAAYDEGAPLFRIARTDRVELELHVPAADVSSIREISGVELELPGRADPLPLRFEHVHHAGVLDDTTRALSVQMEVDNRDRALLIGQSGTAILFTGGTQQFTVVPKAAVLMEAGRPYVFVQTGGEQFARRFVVIAAQDGDRLGLASGVASGDRVVTSGSYDVQLASAAKGLPAEGHVH